MISEKCCEPKQIYSDGSKRTGNNISTASGIYIKEGNILGCWKLNPSHSVIAAELFAIEQALRYVELQRERKTYILYRVQSCNNADCRIQRLIH